jgi:hypothetical protein
MDHGCKVRKALVKMRLCPWVAKLLIAAMDLTWMSGSALLIAES